MASIFEKIHEDGLDDVPDLFDPEVAGTYIDLLCYEELEELMELKGFAEPAKLAKPMKPIKSKGVRGLARAGRREQKACR